MRLICQNDIVASVTSIAFARSVRISFRGPPPLVPASKYRHMFPCVRLCDCHWVNDDDDDDDDSVVVVMVVVVVMAQGIQLPTTQHSTTLFHRCDH
jgi:hypothetical protein